MAGLEKRKHPRISVSVPVSCASIDEEGSPLNFNMGIVKDLSQSGLALEVYGELVSDLVLLSFVDVAGTTLELRGKAVYSKKSYSGTIKLGVLLMGKPLENIDFVKALVRFHHYTKKSTITGAD
jgi:PilZ domain